MTEALRLWWHRGMTTLRHSRVRLLVGLGLLGILLIALSEFLPRRSERQGEGEPMEVTAAQVEAALEERIASLLATVAGVGDCRVLVTLESDARYVYAANTDRTTDGSSSTNREEILVVTTQDGPAGLRLTTLLPTVKGVAVVCAGGGDPAVCQRVTELVTTAFHISERRVCVVPRQH